MLRFVFACLRWISVERSQFLLNSFLVCVSFVCTAICEFCDFTSFGYFFVLFFGGAGLAFVLRRWRIWGLRPRAWKSPSSISCTRNMLPVVVIRAVVLQHTATRVRSRDLCLISEMMICFRVLSFSLRRRPASRRRRSRWTTVLAAICPRLPL